MKRIISIFALGAALMWVSCTKEGPTGVNTISDLYTVPAGAVEMAAPTATSTWSTDRRYFELTFGNDLTTTLVGYDALLAPGQYVLGADEIGKAILAKTKVGGQPAKEGFITVGKRDAEYQISAQVDGKFLFWKGTLPFKADPAPTALTVLQQATKSDGLVTVQLATDGISQEYVDMGDNNWVAVWKGEGKYLAIDLYSADGYLSDGTYVASAQGGVVNPGEFGRGWDPGDLWGIGMEFTDWGTCLWTVKDGAATAAKITGGIITVTSEDVNGEVIWTISWGEKSPVEYVFTGAIAALTKPKKPDGPVKLDYTFTEDELQAVSDQSGAVVAGVLKHPIHIWDKDLNEVAYLELLMAEGETNYEGTYPSTSYASQPGQMADGWEFDGTAWGMGFMSGGSYYVNEAGEQVLMGAGLYTVMVTEVAKGAYRFTSEAFDYAAAGPDYVPGEGGDEGDDDVTGDVVLKLTSGLTYSMEDVTAGNTDSSQNPLSGMTLWRVTVSDGSGAVAAFDLGTAEGSSDLAGEYTVMSYPDAVGKAGNGWGFAAFNMFGGCYYLIDGAHYFIPAGATITVKNNADGTLKIKFEGAIQDESYADLTGGLLLNNIAKQ